VKASLGDARTRGMTVLVVMVLLAVMCVFMVGAAQSITFVKRELKLIEKKQLQRYEKARPAGPKP
jgi:Tfp pilus assembly protein PilX